MLRLAALLAVTLLGASCRPVEPDPVESDRVDADRVEADRYDRFWLWAGVAGRPTLRAKELYLLDGEILGREGGRFVSLRSGTPRLRSSDVWLVIRTDTLRWPGGTPEALVRRVDRWAEAGNRVAGLQVDFDARTRHLDEYAAFLTDLRRRLPAHYRLSITGLMDWSANGDPRALERLRGVVDEVVIQTYQGRTTIDGYDAYFRRMRGFPIPFKVGLVEHGRWIEPRGLSAEPNFKGYVVFLLKQSD